MNEAQAVLLQNLLKKYFKIQKEYTNLREKSIWHKPISELRKLERDVLEQIYKQPVELSGYLEYVKENEDDEGFFFMGELDNKGEVSYDALKDVTEYLKSHVKQKVKITIEPMNEEECNSCTQKFSCWTTRIE
jgi:hypothetical protein